MRRSLGLSIALSVALTTGCGGGDADRTAQSMMRPAANEVAAFDFGFRPADIRVRAGDVVTWRNVGREIHTVKELPGSKERFFSRALDANESYRHRFTRAGTFRYFCTLHPAQMRAVVTVRR